MCGRFTLRTPAQVLVDQLGLDELPLWQPRYNIAPTQTVAIVRPSATGAGRHLSLAHWGLIPSWAKDPSIGNRMINARSETAAEKPSFRAALKKRRCLIPADGFYEWQKLGKQKQPYLISPADGPLFCLAGLWETWQHGGDPLESCTILTTGANRAMQPLYDRMPVILEPADFDRWLAPEPLDDAHLAALLVPCADERLALAKVSTWVNSPTHEDPRCVEPLAAE